MTYLDKIQKPSDIKNFSIEKLQILSDEIRQAILHRSIAYGGHVASNLSVVELTIALHYVFDSPYDKIVFDCSHQCYTHKLLTGRFKGFIFPEYYDSVAGYMNPDESEHDLFEIGHTSTSLSLVSGLVIGRELKHENENIIAIIGDGSLGGGQALEGLNFIGGEIKSNCIVIINDNEFSIAENHGGIYENLKLLRSTNGEAECNFFRAMGFDYYYVPEGNKIAPLIEIFQKIKGVDHPVVIHVHTTKGKGYGAAETDPEKWHYYSPALEDIIKEEYYAEITRNVLRKELAVKNDLVYIAAATPALLPVSMGFSLHEREKMGMNFQDVGIAEEHAVAMASAIAKQGCKPVFSVLATFLQRSFDQLLQDLCINNNPVLLLVWNSGVYGLNDKTHIGHFDIQELAHIPNLLYLVPSCYEEYMMMLQYGLSETKHPIAIRVPSNGVYHAKRSININFDMLEYEIVNQGEEVAIIALGAMFQLGEDVIRLYHKKTGKQLTLINPRYASDIDSVTLEKLKENHKLVVTLEDGIINGGWGQLIASYYGTSDIKVKNYGLSKQFADRYSLYDILYENHLIDRLIVKDIIHLLGTNNKSNTTDDN